MKKPKDMETGSVFDTKNFGKIRIIDYAGHDKVTIEFLATKTQRVVKTMSIRAGAVRDPYTPSIAGVGFTGEGKYNKTRHGKYKKIYGVWAGMIKRCYSQKSQEAHPTYANCTVCKEWHNFQNFAAWFEEHYRDGLHLDKDILVENNKEYSPDKCTFVAQTENSQKAKAMHFTLKDPNNVEHVVYNLEEFCRKNKLDSSSLRQVRAGKREHEKGWKLLTHGIR